VADLDEFWPDPTFQHFRDLNKIFAKTLLANFLLLKYVLKAILLNRRKEPHHFGGEGAGPRCGSGGPILMFNNGGL
jgi:hypothetical protein